AGGGAAAIAVEETRIKALKNIKRMTGLPRLPTRFAKFTRCRPPPPMPGENAYISDRGERL
ncbi:MAG: hypothetical protein ACRER1_08270, partial [Gammaproteobacteria bacterium]